MRNTVSKIKHKMFKMLNICSFLFSSNEADHMRLGGQPSEDWV